MKLRDVHEIAHQKDLVAIGCSTGGPEALKKVIPLLPGNCPGVVIIQHISDGYSQIIAEQLNEISKLEVKTACKGDVVKKGCCYVAPGGIHLQIHKISNDYVINLKDAPPLHGVRPAVDIAFESIAKCTKNRAIGVILTGMGIDGANGVRALKERGNLVIAQNELSSTVFGMPKAAIATGCVDLIRPLYDMANTIIDSAGLQLA